MFRYSITLILVPENIGYILAYKPRLAVTDNGAYLLVGELLGNKLPSFLHHPS